MRNSKLIVSAAVAISALAGVGAASAADMAPQYTKAPPIATAAIYDWTGFYIGAQVGWSQIRDSQTLASPTFVPITDFSHANGVVGGVHAGYNFQASQFVFGVEGDIEGSSIGNNYLVGPPFSASSYGTNKLNWEGSLRGRVGFAVDRVLFYGTGGWAFGQFNDYYSSGAPFLELSSGTRNGWTAGAGLEYALPQNWTVRAEYRYTDWGSHTNNLNVFLAPPGISVDRVTQQAVRVGVSYKFGGPVVAKY
jgi:outer membrane immunogenic protein